jgi:hypothetical protein
MVLSLAACAGWSQIHDAVEDPGARSLKLAVPGVLAALVAPPGLARPSGIAVPSHINKSLAAWIKWTFYLQTVAACI